MSEVTSVEYVRYRQLPVRNRAAETLSSTRVYRMDEKGFDRLNSRFSFSDLA